MSEHLCPISGELCSRPGRVVPGATTISNEGYCGGKEENDGICSIIDLRMNSSDILQWSHNLVASRVNSTTVNIIKSGLDPRSEEIYEISSGYQTQKRKINFPDFSQPARKV